MNYTNGVGIRKDKFKTKHLEAKHSKFKTQN